MNGMMQYEELIVILVFIPLSFSFSRATLVIQHPYTPYWTETESQLL